MSTELQKYSTDNQSDAIRKYAERNQIQIVRYYADKGKSGLNIQGRSGFKQLIADVTSGKAGFNIVLVYDVSRWGRFQNVDESAYLEYLCKLYGIEVRYCAEQFANDGSVSSTIVKSMKRAMAGEYSRELSRKVFEGQCRLASLGYRQGGFAGYGLRRQLIDARGNFKEQLAPKEWKSLQTDRVILVPGPANEVDIVNQIFRLFVDDHLNEREIASYLNNQGRLRELTSPWSYGTVREILTNEKYIGNNIRNRTSFKLKQTRVVTPAEAILRISGAFTPIVDVSVFEKAQSIIRSRYTKYSAEYMLEGLRILLAKEGRLTSPLIDACRDIPHSTSYWHVFGSLLNAYQLIGYSPPRRYDSQEQIAALKALYPKVVSEFVALLEQSGAEITQAFKFGPLTINGEFSASLVLAQCWTRYSRRYWKLRFSKRHNPDISIIARMSESNRTIVDYLVIPRAQFPRHSRFFSLKKGDVSLDAFRCDSLAAFLPFARSLLACPENRSAKLAAGQQLAEGNTLRVDQARDVGRRSSAETAVI